MNIFRRPDYKSVITQFLEEIKTAKPDMAAGQLDGRALLWDKTIDRNAQQGFTAAKVAQQPYVYQTKAK
jgi:hypothetical protein